MNDIDYLSTQIQMLAKHLGVEFETCGRCRGSGEIRGSHPNYPDECPDCVLSKWAERGTGLVLKTTEESDEQE